MAYMPSEDTSVNDVDFFKVDEATYDPKTDAFGSDMLIAENSTRTVTIPSDIKPGIYVVRHEIIGLHFAWQEQPEKKASGAQPYPVCISKFVECLEQRLIVYYRSEGNRVWNGYSPWREISRSLRLA
jgi:Auxiliary Activity family 9 (formerly GH61)